MKKGLNIIFQSYLNDPPHSLMSKLHGNIPHLSKIPMHASQKPMQCSYPSSLSIPSFLAKSLNQENHGTHKDLNEKRSHSRRPILFFSSLTTP